MVLGNGWVSRKLNPFTVATGDGWTLAEETLRPVAARGFSLLLGNASPSSELHASEDPDGWGNCFIHHEKGHERLRGAGGGAALVRLVSCTSSSVEGSVGTGHLHGPQAQLHVL